MINAASMPKSTGLQNTSLCVLMDEFSGRLNSPLDKLGGGDPQDCFESVNATGDPSKLVIKYTSSYSE